MIYWEIVVMQIIIVSVLTMSSLSPVLRYVIIIHYSQNHVKSHHINLYFKDLTLGSIVPCLSPWKCCECCLFGFSLSESV